MTVAFPTVSKPMSNDMEYLSSHAEMAMVAVTGKRKTGSTEARRYRRNGPRSSGYNGASPPKRISRAPLPPSPARPRPAQRRRRAGEDRAGGLGRLDPRRKSPLLRGGGRAGEAATPALAARGRLEREGRPGLRGEGPRLQPRGRPLAIEGLHLPDLRQPDEQRGPLLHRQRPARGPGAGAAPRARARVLRRRARQHPLHPYQFRGPELPPGYGARFGPAQGELDRGGAAPGGRHAAGGGRLSRFRRAARARGRAAADRLPRSGHPRAPARAVPRGRLRSLSRQEPGVRPEGAPRRVPEPRESADLAGRGRKFPRPESCQAAAGAEL